MELIEPPIGKVFTKGFRNYFSHFWTIVINNIICTVTATLASITIIGLIIVPSIYGGYLESLIRIARGQEVKIGSFFSRGFKKFGSLLGISAIIFLIILAISLIVIFGGAFLKTILSPTLFPIVIMIIALIVIFPALYYIISWYFIVNVVVDTETNSTASEAFKKSKDLVTNVAGWWHTSIFIGLVGILYICIEIILFFIEIMLSDLFIIYGIRVAATIIVYPCLAMITIAYYTATVQGSLSHATTEASDTEIVDSEKEN